MLFRSASCFFRFGVACLAYGLISLIENVILNVCLGCCYKGALEHWGRIGLYTTLGSQELVARVEKGDSPDLSCLGEFHTFSWLLSASENSRIAEMTSGALLTHSRKRPADAGPSTSTGGQRVKKVAKMAAEPEDSVSKALSYFK